MRPWIFRPLASALAAAGLALTALPAAAEDPSPLDRLVDRMTGSFSSAAQAEADSAYFDIRLQMVPIWTERTDGAWLYVEQAAASALDRPYRQRVYRVTAEGDTLFRSEVYLIPEPLRFAGAWKREAPLAGLAPDSLEVRDGCAVLLRPTADGDFTGSTVDAECTSNLRGAAYATSEVTVRAGSITSWDRGFDADGVQVWGAEKGPYIFLRGTP